MNQQTIIISPFRLSEMMINNGSKNAGTGDLM